MVLRFKRKDLIIEEIQSDVHRDGITALRDMGGMIVSGSNDKTIAVHKRSEDRIMEKMIMRIGMDEKINDVCGRTIEQLYVADMNKTISKITIKY